MSVRILHDRDWKVTAAAPARRARRGGPAAASPVSILPEAMLPEGATLGESGSARRPARRGAGSGGVQMEVDSAAGERVLLVTRLPSGALRFHAPVERAERRTRGRGPTAGGTARFVIPPGAAPAAAARRGLFSDAFDWVVVKIKEHVVDKVTGVAFRLAARAAEKHWWGKEGEGLYRVEESGGALRLTKATAAEVRGPALLFLHGTFSNTLAAFGDLATAPGKFFESARKQYGDNIFAWNHYTVSKAPEDNAKELLAALPAGGTEFDVITHSRGGLVLRLLAERPDLAGPHANRFRLRRAVLVACPNGGTPWMKPGRWEETLGAVANVMEMFPANPWTTGAKFIADGLVWLASHVSGDLPGLHSMDADGETIAALQEAAPLVTGEYSALAANFHPADALWQRFLDAGLDAFFATANDIVVPSEGSWLADGAGALIPATRIACFGEGGNLDPHVQGVNHLNFFSQAATVDFLLKSLRLSTGALPPPFDPATVLPTRKISNLLRRRGGARGIAATLPAPPDTGGPPAPPRRGREGGRSQEEPKDTAYRDRTLHLIIMDELSDQWAAGKVLRGTKEQRRKRLTILATYSNARLRERFPISDYDEKSRQAFRDAQPLTVAEMLPGRRFYEIIRMHRIIDACLNGVPGSDGTVPKLPGVNDLTMLGELLFRALFVGDIRRLYDTARAEQQQQGLPLNIVLTSTVPWLAGLPWEFAFDPVRRKFLASEEVHFTRSVMSAVPAEAVSSRSDKLRILVVGAQPKDATPLSIAEEEKRLRHAFGSLIEEGIAEVQTLLDASPGALHEYLIREQICERRFDIVHFISHGVFAPRDEEGAPGDEEGRVLFTGRDGMQQEVEVRPLREILCSRGIQLIFVNACESAVDSRKDDGDQRRGRARGVAQALVEGGLPSVIGNQYTVLDSSVVAFSECFYRSLALGSSLGQAAREARISLNYAVDGEAIDWAVPVLFARDPDARLCPRRCAPMPAARSLPALRAARSRLAAGRRQELIRVGMADISRYFPEFPELLDVMNARQEVFEFVPADVPIPLGVWELYKIPTPERPSASLMPTVSRKR